MLPQSETERLLEATPERLRRPGRAPGRAAELRAEATRGRPRCCATPTDARKRRGRLADRLRRRAQHRAPWPRPDVRGRSRWTATGCWPTSICAGLHRAERAGHVSGTRRRSGPVPDFARTLPGHRRCLPTAGQRPPGRPTLDEVQALLDRRGPGGITAPDPVWLSAFRINERKVGGLSRGPGLPGRRCRACPQPGRRPGHEHRHAGCLQPRLEAGPGLPGTWRRSRCSTATASSAARIGQQVSDGHRPPDHGRGAEERALRSIRNRMASLACGLAPVRRAMADTLTELSVGYPEAP